MSGAARIAGLRATRDIDVGGGYIIATEFGASGGVHYERPSAGREVRETRGGRGRLERYETTKRIDDLESVAMSNQIVNRAYYLVEKFCTRTPLGYYCPAERLTDLDRAMEEVTETAQLFNDCQRDEGGARRVTVALYPLRLAMDDRRAAVRLSETVRERLRAVTDALRAGDVKATENALDRCRNLEGLATGVQREAIQVALDSARDAKRQLAEALRGGADALQAAAALDVEAIEATERLFY